MFERKPFLVAIIHVEVQIPLISFPISVVCINMNQN